MAWGPLTVVFARTSSLGSAIIRAMPPASRWSHCGIVADGGVIEALAFKGVVWTPWAEFEARQSAWQTLALSCPRPHAGENWARSTIGAKYDYLGFLGIPLRQDTWESHNRWYCSRHVAVAAKKAGQPVYKVPRSTHGLTPGHVESLLFAADARLVETGGRA